MRHLVYNVRYIAEPINSSLLTVTSHSTVRRTFFYNDTKFFLGVIAVFISIINLVKTFLNYRKGGE